MFTAEVRQSYEEYILAKLPHTHRHTQHVHMYNINIQKMVKSLSYSVGDTL